MIRRIPIIYIYIYLYYATSATESRRVFLWLMWAHPDDRLFRPWHHMRLPIVTLPCHLQNQRVASAIGTTQFRETWRNPMHNKMCNWRNTHVPPTHLISSKYIHFYKSQRCWMVYVISMMEVPTSPLRRCLDINKCGWKAVRHPNM